MKTPILYIVIPCYNEEKVLPMTAPLFAEKIRTLAEKGKIHSNSKVLFVNDGSKDKTWEIIKNYPWRIPAMRESAKAETGGIKTLCLPG